MSEIVGGPAIGSGWFHDPAGSANLRWWDGTAWTAHLIDPATGVAPLRELPAAVEPVAIEPAAVEPATVEPATVEPAAVAPELTARETERTVVAEDSSQPLTRRELRERASVGVAPVAIDTALEAAVDSPIESPVEPPTVTEPAAAAVPELTPFEQLMAASAPEASAPESVTAESFSAQSANSDSYFTSVDGGNSQPWIPAAAPQANDVYPLQHDDAGYEPMVRTRPPVDAAQDVPIGTSSTTAIWIYAALPVLHFALAWFVYERLKPVDDTGIRWVVLLGPILIYLILAAIDRSRLVAHGHTRAPSPLLALIPPLYIGIRAARLGLGAVIPAVVWLVLQAAVIAAMVMFFPALTAQLTSAESAVPTTTATPQAVLTPAQRAEQLTPTGMAAKIISDFAAKNITFTSVTCPVMPNVFDGAQTVCVAKLAGGTENLNVSVTASSPYTAFAVVGIGALIS